MYECSCGETFESYQKLGGHKAGQHSSKSVECEYCNNLFRKSGISQHKKACKYNPKNKSVCKREGCEEVIHKRQKFCSESCAATHNNSDRTQPLETKKKISKSLGGKGYDRDEVYRECSNCGSKTRNQKYCSNSCQSEHRTEQKFEHIEESGEANFEGVNERTNAKWIKRYLIEKNGEKCMRCGWNEENPHTGNVPIELDHIDGNHENNTLKNCRILCPNCHSLTKTYKGANLGNGRTYRL